MVKKVKQIRTFVILAVPLTMVLTVAVALRNENIVGSKFWDLSIRIAVAAILVAVLLTMLLWILHGLSNLKSCKDGLFAPIDDLRRCCGESCEGYNLAIQMVNAVYAGDEFEDILERKQTQRLYARKQYLQDVLDLSSDLTNFFISLVISALASVLVGASGGQTAVGVVVTVVLIVVGFFACVMMKFSVGAFRAPGHKDQVVEYELKRLESEIYEYEQRLGRTNQDERVLKTVHASITALSREQKGRRKRVRAEIDRSITAVEGLDLLNQEYRNKTPRAVTIGGNKAYLWCEDRLDEDGKRSEVLTPEYSELCAILDKHGLLVYTEKTSKS